ncbi:MAG TPA: RusA family crossover junction endodeoxyribonuclease [Nitrospirales bacterium]|nr:RusA family crossover junction endodeoxyribonuclease [Nitrospirales bacterium]
MAAVPAPLPPADIAPDRLTISLPVPPSINHQYATVNGRRVLSAVGRDYKTHVGHLIMVALAKTPHREKLLQRVRTDYLALSLQFFFQSPLRRDLDGGLKITQDAVAEALGINDVRIVELHLFKALSTAHPRVDCSVSPATLK